MIVQHSGESTENFTPPEYVEAARRVLGHIDLDLASSASASSSVSASSCLSPRRRPRARSFPCSFPSAFPETECASCRKAPTGWLQALGPPIPP
jgi:hypothetical protein